MATLIQTGCHSHKDPAYKWVSPDQGTKNNFSICRKGSASAPEITKLFLSFFASRRVYPPWAFRYASGMPQEWTHNLPLNRKLLKSKDCAAAKHSGLVLFVLYQDPQRSDVFRHKCSSRNSHSYHCPRGDGDLQVGDYLWVGLDCPKLVSWSPEGARTDDIGKKNLQQTGILSGDTTEYFSQQAWHLLNRFLRPGSLELQGRQYTRPQKRASNSSDWPVDFNYFFHLFNIINLFSIIKLPNFMKPHDKEGHRNI